MRADIHDGPEQRPDTLMQVRICQVDETSCNARPDHTLGQTEKHSARSAVGRSLLTAPRPDPCVQNSRTRLPPWVSDGELAVCAPAPVTRIFGTVSEACFAGSHSPWPPPLAPPAPQWPKPPCSSASQLLWRSLTSRDRASSATAPRLPDADRRLLPNGRSRDLPVPKQGACAHASVSDHAGSSERSRYRAHPCCLPSPERRRRPE